MTNDLSDSSFRPRRRNSYDNELNSHGKRLLDICKSALRAYKKLLNKKKKMITTTDSNWNHWVRGIENAEVSDKKRFWDCWKSMDDMRKDKDDIPSISKDNW